MLTTILRVWTKLALLSLRLISWLRLVNKRQWERSWSWMTTFTTGLPSRAWSNSFKSTVTSRKMVNKPWIWSWLSLKEVVQRVCMGSFWWTWTCPSAMGRRLRRWLGATLTLGSTPHNDDHTLCAQQTRLRWRLWTSARRQERTTWSQSLSSKRPCTSSWPRHRSHEGKFCFTLGSFTKIKESAN